MARRILQVILLLGAALFGAGVVLFFLQNPIYAQTTYFGPTSPQPGLVMVDVQIFDDPSLGGVKIEEVVFNGQMIPLKPAGIHGLRGGGGFQLRPGTYKLSWKVSRISKDWPKTISHQEKIVVQSNDTWVQVEIHGEKSQIL